jgi:L-iditol 2-dehydrogenase
MFCSKRRGMGHGVNGAFTHYSVVRPDQVYRLPERFSLAEAALSEPFAAAIQAVTELASEGDMVLTLGAGNVSQIGPQIVESLQKQEAGRAAAQPR